MTVIPSPLHAHTGATALALDAIAPHGFDDAAVEQVSRWAQVHADGVPIVLRRPQRDPAAAAAELPAMHPSGVPVDERHRIRVDATGIVVEAATDAGAFRAMTTIAHSAAVGTVAHGTIEDAPRFGWRGLSLDVARTPMPIEGIRAIVEILASLKLNVLHLHLTDDQGWRLPIEGHPELTEVGGPMAMAGRPGFAYGAAEYIELEAWARDRHVWIVPEIDMPGHVGALLAARPDLAAGSGTPGEYASRLHLDPDDDAVYELLADVLEATSRLHASPYLHIGGDEAFGMDDAAYAGFLQRLIDRLGLDRSRLIAWQEAARGGAGIETLQVWRDLDREGLETDPEARRRLGLLAAADLDVLTRRGREDVARISVEGRGVILSPLLVAYLDRPYADRAAETAGLSGIGLPIYLPRTVRQSFEFAIETVVPGLDPAAVRGVEAALWTETIADAETAERMLLPRLAGIAQRSWEHEPATWDDHAARLRAVADIWDRRGFRHLRSELVHGAQQQPDCPADKSEERP
ncbi:family 20 glycosylhydrolase [Agrococcus baldri]|uniref:beta-N-acetylhexosaminidase n=1 Tax=Agrococcus baldri TaxID=153730 RepID=A0AA87RAP4_9MICO|nr:family 20 glycosylhydrolase [Agrococcus baldri]GEK79222.1 beta-N-acetylhexosaminidase [Agrococcus baldri]